jgi:hypothetical protein
MADYFLNSTGATVDAEDHTGALVTWAIGGDGLAGTSTSAPWQNISKIASLPAGTHTIWCVGATTSGAGEITSAGVVAVPTGVDVTIRPAVNNSIIKLGGSNLARGFSIVSSSFLRVVAGLSGQVFQFDHSALGTASNVGGLFRLDNGSTGTYGIEINGAHKHIDSGTPAVTGRPIATIAAPASITAIASAPAGTPTFILRNGAKLIGEAGTNIRGIGIWHLGAGVVTIDGLDCEGAANHTSSGATSVARSCDYKGLLNIETASPGASVIINNTYGEFTPVTTGRLSVIRIMDCRPIITNINHKIKALTNCNVCPMLVSGYNQDCSFTALNYNAEVTTNGANVASGYTAVLGADGRDQPALFLSSSAAGAGVTCVAEYDLFMSGDVGRVVTPTSGTGTFTITGYTSARQVTVTNNATITIGTTIRSYSSDRDIVAGDWRIASRVSSGVFKSGSTRGADYNAASTLHGVIVGGCSNVIVDDLMSSYVRYGIILKDSVGCTVSNSETDYIYTNGYSLIDKGSEGVVFSNNDCQLRTGNYSGGLYQIQTNDYNIVSDGGRFVSNEARIPAGYTGVLFSIQSGTLNPQAADNRYVTEDGSAVPSLFTYGGSSGNSFASWQAQSWTHDESNIAFPSSSNSSNGITRQLTRSITR